MSLRHHLLAALAVAFTGGVVLPSCNEDLAKQIAALGEGCLLNSDCSDGLVCVFRRCHEQCNDSADCPLGPDGVQLGCRLGDPPAHVCQLPEDASCSYNSQCPGAQVCGPDGSCRDQCEGDRDCLEEQMCVQGVCAEVDEVDPVTQSLLQQPEPSEQTGVSCEYDHQCEGLSPEGQPELVCRNGACGYDCFTDVDCEPNEVCVPQDVLDDDSQDPSTPGACFLANDGNVVYCIPGHQVACDCLGGTQGVQQCAADGSGYTPCQDVDGDC